MRAFCFKLCSWIKKILEIGYGRCFICFKVQRSEDLKSNLCKYCLEKLYVCSPKSYCPKCGKVYSDVSEGIVCGDCKLKHVPWDKFAFFGVYQGILRNIIISFKFNKSYHLGSLLGKLLIEAYDKSLSGFKPDIIVPVPVFRNHLRIKGFSHVVEMSRALSKYLKVKLELKALLKIKPTRPQVGLDHKERWKNLKDAFWANKRIVDGKRILLIDDVFTTGATAFMCSDVLKKAGADAINLLVIARSVE